MKHEVKIPTIGESINEVTVGQWLVEDGARVDIDQTLCEIESEKATVELSAEESGVIKIIAEEGDTVEVGSVIAEIESDGKAAGGKESSKAEEKEEKPGKTAEGEAEPGKKEEDQQAENKISPVASNILKEAGISIDSVSGSGQDGKILKSDALKAVEKKEEQEKDQKRKSEAPKEEKAEESPKRTIQTDSRTEKREKMSTLRKTISRRLLEAKQNTAMLTTMNEIDMSQILELRKKYKEKFKEKYEINLGFMSFFCKAVSLAVEDFPIVNARIDGEEIVYYNYCDVSIAVSTPKGLVVPVVRNVEKLNLYEIEKSIADLAGKARENRLTIDEMSGGTFSITNGGVFGSLLSTPLINSPQSAILGMHAIQERPVVRNGEIVIRPMMYVALSYDHRIIDGRESVSFLARLKEILEDPVRMLLTI
jgi:2-oxoglutarate dehydrogenase E2 component (dihydrolipoamide succinyltransferase)